MEWTGDLTNFTCLGNRTIVVEQTKWQSVILIWRPLANSHVLTPPPKYMTSIDILDEARWRSGSASRSQATGPRFCPRAGQG